MLDKKEIGKNLERARLKIGLSKGRFARIAGVDASQYGRVEKGDEGFSRENLLLIAERHGVNVDFLSTGKGAILISETVKENNPTDENVTEPVQEMTHGQILTVLAMALKDQAKAFADQADLLKEMKKGMARQDSQTIIENKVKSIEELSQGMASNLKRTLAAALTVAKGQEDAMKEIRSLLSPEQARKKAPSQGDDKGRSRIDEAPEKKGKSSA